MRVTTLRTYKLRELVGYNYIHSIVVVNNHYGTSMCIATKGDVNTEIQYALNLRRYGPAPGTVLFISMDNRFTYHYPVGIAIPTRDWDNIRIRLCETENHQRFTRARIIKNMSSWAL